MAYNMHYVMEKWLVQSLDTITSDARLTWLVIKTYYSTYPRPSLEQVRKTVVPLFLAIIEDDEFDGGEELSERTRWSRFQSAALRELADQEDEMEREQSQAAGNHADSSEGTDGTSDDAAARGASDGANGGLEDSECDLDEEKTEIEGTRPPVVSDHQRQSLRRYGWRDHGKVALKAALENLAVLPFWAVKVQAVTSCGRVKGLNPYPWHHGGCVTALKCLVQEEGFWKGLFKGALPMLTLGVTQALYVAMQRHVRFVRRVELSRSVLAPLGGSIGGGLNHSHHNHQHDAHESTTQPTTTGDHSQGHSHRSSSGSTGKSSNHGSHGRSSSSSRGSRGSRVHRSGTRRMGDGLDAGYLSASDPWQFLSQLVRVCIRHPFELLGVRLVTSSLPPYTDFGSAIWHHLCANDLASLFVGVRQSLFNAVFLPRAIHHLLLLGVPSMLHARRMLPPGHAAGTGSAAGEGHSGLGGSVGLLSNIVRNAGPSGLLISARAALDIAPYAAASVLTARTVGWLLLGPSREAAARERIRTAYLRERFQPRPNAKDGSNNEPSKPGTPQGSSSNNGNTSELPMKRRQPTTLNLAGLVGGDQGSNDDAPARK